MMTDKECFDINQKAIEGVERHVAEGKRRMKMSEPPEEKPTEVQRANNIFKMARAMLRTCRAVGMSAGDTLLALSSSIGFTLYASGGEWDDETARLVAAVASSALADAAITDLEEGATQSPEQPQ